MQFCKQVSAPRDKSRALYTVTYRTVMRAIGEAPYCRDPVFLLSRVRDDGDSEKLGVCDLDGSLSYLGVTGRARDTHSPGPLGHRLGHGEPHHGDDD
jgi:hypothetical protein